MSEPSASEPQTNLWRRFRTWHGSLGAAAASTVTIGIVVGVVAAGAGVVALYDLATQESQAREACEEHVMARLKSPSSAEFQDDAIVYEEDEGYRVVSSVDSQNGFGAMVRTDFSCAVEKASYGWFVADFEVAGE